MEPSCMSLKGSFEEESSLEINRFRHLVVGVGEMKISSDPEEILVTYSLGSCIGVAVYDPMLKTGGLAHCMMPLSQEDPLKAKINPFKYTDTGVTGLLQAFLDLGSRKQNLIVKIAGAGSSMDQSGRFRIGERNYTVLRKILWKNNILITAEDVGGKFPRTIYLSIKDGKTVIKKWTGK